MDPNYGYNPEDYAGQADGGYFFDGDWADAAAMDPDAMMPLADPASWYAGFDYDPGADPDAFRWSDPAQANAGDAEMLALDGTEQAGGVAAAAASSSKAGAKRKEKHKTAASSAASSSQAQPTEYKFRNEMPTAADWEAQKAAIKELYLTRKLSLREVVEAMKENFEFAATERMYKHQFKKWNWNKYNKNKGRK